MEIMSFKCEAVSMLKIFLPNYLKGSSGDDFVKEIDRILNAFCIKNYIVNDYRTFTSNNRNKNT